VGLRRDVRSRPAAFFPTVVGPARPTTTVSSVLDHRPSGSWRFRVEQSSTPGALIPDDTERATVLRTAHGEPDGAARRRAITFHRATRHARRRPRFPGHAVPLRVPRRPADRTAVVIRRDRPSSLSTMRPPRPGRWISGISGCISWQRGRSRSRCSAAADCPIRLVHRHASPRTRAPQLVTRAPGLEGDPSGCRHGLCCVCGRHQRRVVSCPRGGEDSRGVHEVPQSNDLPIGPVGPQV